MVVGCWVPRCMPGTRGVDRIFFNLMVVFRSCPYNITRFTVSSAIFCLFIFKPSSCSSYASVNSDISILLFLCRDAFERKIRDKSTATYTMTSLRDVYKINFWNQLLLFNRNRNF